MATNIEMNIKQTDGTYNPLYPSTIASQVSGTFATSQIPSLAASKITSGTFDAARIPNLDTSKITSGTFADARIPTLAASKISEGTFSGTKTGEYIFPGNVRIGGTGSSSNAKLRIGDGEYVFFHEDVDDCLTIKAKRIEFTTTQSPGLTNNGVQIGNSGGESGSVIMQTLTYTGTGSSVYSYPTIPNGYSIFGLEVYPITGFTTPSTKNGGTLGIMTYTGYNSSIGECIYIWGSDLALRGSSGMSSYIVISTTYGRFGSYFSVSGVQYRVVWFLTKN